MKQLFTILICSKMYFFYVIANLIFFLLSHDPSEIILIGLLGAQETFYFLLLSVLKIKIFVINIFKNDKIFNFNLLFILWTKK